MEPTGACPRCQLPVGALDGDAGYACAICGGQFLRDAALRQKLLAASAEHTRAVATGEVAAFRAEAHLEPVRYLSCPECHDPMSRVSFGLRSGIIVDVCRAHGTWFDAGELDGVLAFVRARGLGSIALAAPSERVGRPEEELASHQAPNEWHETVEGVRSLGDLVEVLFAFF